MAIAALDARTAKFITTTQIVTSVSTAVKELVENAIDANSNSVEIKLEENGASLIEIADNGNGISEIDAPFMGLQSYTSKITDFSDLESLASYGFRGEALSSLCSVAEVTIITKTDGDVAARLYRMNHDGSIRSSELYHRSTGTTIQARSMFKDLPVRRQLLTNGKRSIQEVKVLENLLRAYGICIPRLRINYKVNGSLVFAKLQTENSRECLTSVFGKKFVAQMDFLETESSEVDVHLTIPRKDATELSEICLGIQHVFVNQRPVVYKEIEKVINQRLVDYFGDKIPVRKKLSFFLSLKVPASEVDVNLEPNKTSVFLANRAQIVEKLDKILVKFYGITSKTEDSLAEISSATGKDLSTEYNDISLTEQSAKKRKIDNTIDNFFSTGTNLSGHKKVATNLDRKTPKNNRTAAKKLFQTPSEKLNDADKENLLSKSLRINETSRDSTEKILKETISQLLVVDLGEDFNSQEINDLPNLDAQQVESILGEKGNQKIDSSKMDLLTEEEWSKGRGNIPGATDVHNYNNAVDHIVPEAEITVADSNSTGCKGFARFRKEMRQRIITENPGINFVQTAKILTARWKDLSPEERGYYRDLAAADKRNDENSVASEKSVKRKNSNDEAESNKKRFISLLDKMKHTGPETTKQKLMMRTVVPWIVNLRSVTNSFVKNVSKADSTDKSIVVGNLDENLWLAKTGIQIWALSLDQLFDGLNIDRSMEKTTTRETIEPLVARWMSEKEDLTLLHPVFEMR